MSPNPKVEVKTSSEPPEEVDAGLAATGEYPHADSPEVSPVLKGGAKSRTLEKPITNPADHGSDGQE